MEISGKKIIVTGAASGFGLSLVERLVDAGASIAAIDINCSKLKELESRYSNVSQFYCDVSDNIQVESCVDEIVNEFGRVDVLVNNAGIMKNAPLINILDKTERKHSIALWDQVISINQNSVFFMTRSVVETMIEKKVKGVIINISSIAAKGNIGQTAYSASKAAVEAMTKVWAKEFGRFGIRSVAIAPGFINTKGAKDALEERVLKQWVDKTPLRRTGEIREIIDAIIFVIENDFLNGEIVSINGGLVL